MQLIIEIPDGKVASLKNVLANSFPEYTTMTPAQFKTAEEARIKDIYISSISSVKRSIAQNNLEATARSESVSLLQV